MISKDGLRERERRNRKIIPVMQSYGLQKLKTCEHSDPTMRKQILWDLRVHLLEVDYTFQDTRGP